MNTAVLIPEASAHAYEKCRICRGKLCEDEGDNFIQGICTCCSTRPEAKRLGAAPAPGVGTEELQAVTPPARAFTPAEKSLISKMHGLMPPQQLLDLLNERLSSDLGPDAGKYTLKMLNELIVVFAPPAETGKAAASKPATNDWAGLRKLLAQARRDGTLGKIDKQVINDFAVIFSLNPKQVLVLEDILLKSQEDE